MENKTKEEEERKKRKAKERFMNPIFFFFFAGVLILGTEGMFPFSFSYRFLVMLFDFLKIQSQIFGNKHNIVLYMSMPI